jgi:hypothetical protein
MLPKLQISRELCFSLNKLFITLSVAKGASSGSRETVGAVRVADRNSLELCIKLDSGKTHYRFSVFCISFSITHTHTGGGALLPAQSSGHIL